MVRDALVELVASEVIAAHARQALVGFIKVLNYIGRGIWATCGPLAPSSWSRFTNMPLHRWCSCIHTDHLCAALEDLAPCLANVYRARFPIEGSDMHNASLKVKQLE